MDEQQIPRYLYLIEELLRCPPGREEAVLSDNSDLLDANLLRMIKQRAAVEKDRDTVNRLNILAKLLEEKLNPPSRKNQKQLVNQDQLDFLLKVLQATLESKGNPQVVYPLLAANQDKLDYNFIGILQAWAKGKLPEVEAPQAEDIARLIGQFGNLIQEFPLGNKAANMEISLACCEIILTVFTRHSHAETWAMTHNDLGLAYKKRISGNRAENLELAIAAFQEALQVRTRETLPIDWAETQNDLGAAYFYRISGNRAENLELAIAAFQEVLQVCTREASPIDWAAIQNNLGAAYLYRISGNRAENLELAIAAFQEALQVRTYETLPIDWAETQNNLGAAYCERISGDRAKNLELAIASSQEALEVFTCEALPINCAETQNNLGVAYLYRISGDRAENLELAITAFQEALQVRTRETLPINWAETQTNLGVAYSQKISGDRAENQEMAIAAYENALQVYTCEAIPISWALIQNNLGAVYSQKISGDRAENQERVIAAFQEALQVRTCETLPINWAETQNNLGAVYSQKISGDRAKNQEMAIAAYENALQVCTRETLPISWAMIQNNLGAVYSQKISGDKAENQERAIAAFQEALQVRTLEELPFDWAQTQNNLGNAYNKKISGNRAENQEMAINIYQQVLQVCTRETFPIQWAMTQNNLGLVYREKISGHRVENLDIAIAAFQDALEVLTPEVEPIKCFGTSCHLGNLHFNQSNWQAAIDAYKQAIAVVERSRSWATTDDRRQEIMTEAIAVYQLQVQAYINTEQLDKAIETVERSKARNLVELLTNRDLYPKGDIPPDIITHLDELRRNIPSLEGELQVATDQLSGNTDEQKRPSLEESRKRLQQELQESRQQLDELLKQINDRYDSSFTLTQKVETIPFSDIESLIDERTAIIEWYLTRDEIITFIVTSQSQQPIIIPQSSPEKLKTLENWEQEYINTYREQKSQWITNLFTRLTDLAQILDLDSILSEIDAIFEKQGVKCDRLILIPHRFLHLFPLHALPLSNSNEELLLDRFERGVSYAPSSQLLKLTKEQHRPHFNNLFAIQNPTRTDEKPLLGSKLEVDKIRQYFDPNDSIILAEAEATEANLNQKKEQLRSAHCLHFSCHGKFKFESPLESALLLSDPEGKLEADADLTLYKIFKLDLSQCRIVGFSACESGMTLSGNKEDTDLPSGLDEYIGLPSGFLYAGSPSVVSTLWTVDPLATALLVIKFYKNLKRLPKLGDGDVSTALVRAQYWLRTLSSQKLARIQKNQRFKLLIAQIFENNKRERGKFNDLLYAAIKRKPYPFAKPYYWAASVATGT